MYQHMDHIKAIYLSRHVYKFEDAWEETKFPMRNIDDLNGFLCCLCCVIPFGVFKACIMSTIHLLITIPLILLVSLILFPYQLFIIYITTLSTILLGPKIKFVLFFTNWLLYTIFIIFYLTFAILSCIYFSFYAAFKVTLSDNYNVFGGYIDPMKILFHNIYIYLFNNTKEFQTYCHQIKYYILNEEQGDIIWDISFISWCTTLMSIIMTTLSVIFIMSFIFIEIIIYFIPFSIHLMINLYVFKFLKYYFTTMIVTQYCLALIIFPFIIFPILFIPIFAALYLICYVWLYSSFFNKAIIIQTYIDNPFDCLQQWSYIFNTIILYNKWLCKYSFQCWWNCHCLHTSEKHDDDGFDLEKQIQNIKNKNKKKSNDDYDPYEIKFRQLSAVFWETKNNGDLVTFGKKQTEEQIQQKRKEIIEKENYKTQQMNIERWHSLSPKINGKGKKYNKNVNGKQIKNGKKKGNMKTRKKRVNSDSMSFERKLQNGKHKYNHIDMRTVNEEEVTDSEELNVLMLDNDRYNNDSNKQTGFEYPKGI
eukprot:195823_1